MTAPRTRTRARPHTHTESEETRNAGQTVSNTQTVKHKPVISEPEILTVGTLMTARVRITDGVTVNMGDYSSYRRDVGLEMDVELGEGDPEEMGALTAEQQRRIDVAYDRASAWVGDRLQDVVDDAREFFADVR